MAKAKSKTVSKKFSMAKALASKKAENEKSMRGTVSLFKDPKSGRVIYIRGRKVFERNPFYSILGTVETDLIAAAYTARREYLLAVKAGRKDVTVFAKIAKTKSGAEASLKLQKLFPKVGT